MRADACLAVAVVLIGGCGGGTSARPSTNPTPLPASPPAPGGRAAVDLPDDMSGNQVHVIYVLPRDGVDQNLDIDGTLSGSMLLAQNWFASQTNGRRVRYDTHRGTLDMTFVRLHRS